MPAETPNPRTANQIVSAADLAQIAAHYKTSTAFVEEVCIEPPSDEYDPT
jgi:hypothetical protein